MKNAGAALAVGLIAFATYVVTLCPTVYVGDSGELAWAAVSLGIAHQPGYPLWTLLGRVATLVSPGAAIVALNFTSALFAAAAAALLSLLLSRLTGRILVSAGAALAFALSRGVWSQATITEVYALNLLMSVAALLAAVTARDGRPKLFALSAYLLGLGAANHPLVLGTAPGIAWLWFARRREADDGSAGPAVPQLLGLAGAFALGLSAYLYLPVRWSAGPEMVWGAVSSLGGILDHVLRAQYSGLGEGAASFAVRLRVFLGILTRSAPVGLLAVAAVGVIHAWRSRRSTGVLLVLLLAVTGPVAVAAIHYNDTFLDRSVAAVFFTPAVLAAFLAAGVGLAALDALASARFRDQGRVGLLFTLVLTVVPPAYLQQRNERSCDRSDSRLGRRYAEAVLGSLPQGARIFTTGDNSTFLFAYFQKVEGLRPDVTLSDQTLNLFVESYGEDFVALSRAERKQRRASREVEIAYENRDVPIFYTEPVDLNPFGECRMVPAGLVNQLLRPGEAAAEIVYQPLSVPPVDPDEYLEVHLAGVALYREGRWLVDQGRVVEARDSFRRAADVASRVASILRNLGLEHLGLGEPAGAERRFREALALEPDNINALYNLGVLYAYLDRTEESLAEFDRILELDDSLTEVHLNRGIQLVRASRLEEARAAARRALELEPELESALTLEKAVDVGLEVGGEAGILEALRLVEPVTTGGTLQLAQRYLERGEMERANDLYREAYRKSPESLQAAYGLGYGMLRLGNVDAASEAFHRVVKLDPASAAGRNALAYVFALTGDSLHTAEILALEALQLDPTLAAYWNDTLGWIRYRAGNPQAALETLLESERTLPVDDISMRAENDYHIGVVLLEMDRREEAGEYLSRSIGRATNEPWIPDVKARAREAGIEVDS